MSTIFWLVVALAIVAQVSALLQLRPALALALTLVVGLGSSFVPPSFGLSFDTITISPGDGLAVVLLVTVAVGLATGRFSVPPARLWCALLAMVALACLRGLPEFGVEEVGNAVRGHLHFCSVALFFASIPVGPSLVGVMHRCWALASWGLVGAALVFWFHNGWGAGLESRALTATAALIVAQATMMSVARDRSSPLTRFLPAAGLVILLLVQQRTVWAATLVSLAAVASSNGSRLGGNVRRARLLLGAAVVAVVLLVAAGPPGLGQSLDHAVREPTGEDSTFAWRVDGWQELLGRRSSIPVLDVVVGDPAGTGFERRIGDTVTQVSAHNYYVTLLTSLGLIGLVTFLLGYAGLLRRLSTRARALAPSSNDATVLWMLLLGQLTYFIGYQTTMEQGIVAGLASALAWSAQPRKFPSEEGELVLQS